MATSSSDGTHTVFAAKVKGAIGNQIATTETQTNASFAGGTMTGGSGDMITSLSDLLTYTQANSELEQSLGNILNPL